MTYETIEFRVLGPIEVLVDDQDVMLNAGRLRRLLAALLIRPREVLTPDQLIEDVWGGRAHRTAKASLHNLVSSLRAIFGSELLITTNAGYVLAVENTQVDARRFETLLSDAPRGDARDRVRKLSDALALWRGSPFVDVRYESFAQPEIVRLEELYIWALEEQLEARLELEQSDAVIAELSGLVVRFPHRERLRRLLMVALHRAGRPVDAVAVYVDWHRRLTADGFVPSSAMSQVRIALEVQAPGIASDLMRFHREPGRYPRRQLRQEADEPGIRRLRAWLVAAFRRLRSSTAERRAPTSATAVRHRPKALERRGPEDRRARQLGGWRVGGNRAAGGCRAWVQPPPGPFPTPWPRGEARACKARTRRFDSVRCLDRRRERRSIDT